MAPSLAARLLGALLWAARWLLSSLVLLLAVLWGMHESSALRQGRGVDVPSSLSGVNAIVTGSTAGIGFEAALQLYELGAHVLIHSSSQKRASSSAKAIEEDFARARRGKVTPLAADLSDFEEVLNFSKKLPAIMPRVHLLFLNAAKIYGMGAMYKDDSVLKLPASEFKARSGHDRCMAVNHLGHYFLTWLLLPQLAPSATIVVVTSSGAFAASHRRIMPPWGYLGGFKINNVTSNPKRIYWEVQAFKKHANLAYLDSKYANICFSRWLRRHLGDNYTVVLHDPGLVVTSPTMSRDSPTYRQRLYRDVLDERLWAWHAPSVDGGRHLLESAFITRRPVPDWVASYFFPEQVVGWFTPHYWEAWHRNRFLIRFAKLQKLTWGLHASVGPQCDPDLQDRFMAWSAETIGLKRTLPATFRG